MTFKTNQFTTIESLRNLEHEYVDTRGRRSVLSLIGFPLMAKVTGRIVGASMGIAGAQIRASRVQDIDGANEVLNAMRSREANSRQQEDAGFTASHTPEAVLAHWLAIREGLVDLGIEPMEYTEQFTNMIHREASKHAPTEAEITLAAKMSGLTAKQSADSFAAQGKRKSMDTLATADAALGIILDATPNEIFDDEELDARITTMIDESFDSAKKSLLKTSDSVQDALASLMLLNASLGFEEEVDVIHTAAPEAATA